MSLEDISQDHHSFLAADYEVIMLMHPSFLSTALQRRAGDLQELLFVSTISDEEMLGCNSWILSPVIFSVV